MGKHRNISAKRRMDIRNICLFYENITQDFGSKGLLKYFKDLILVVILRFHLLVGSGGSGG